MALSQQSKPMKTISLSALILIASPFCVVAQDAPQTNNSYYADVPAKIIDSANHVVFSKPSSALETRGQAVVQKVIAPALKTPVVEMSVFKNSKATLQWPGTNTAEARREPTYQSVGKLVVEKEFDIEVPEVSALNYLLKRDELIPDRIEELAQRFGKRPGRKTFLVANSNRYLKNRTTTFKWRRDGDSRKSSSVVNRNRRRIFRE